VSTKRPSTSHIIHHLALLLAFLAPPLAAQPLDLNTPASSPLWWPLTDELTPSELRRQYRDHDGSLERLAEAVELGLEPPQSPETLSRLRFYLHFELHSELVPLWMAYRDFSSEIRFRGEPEQAIGRLVASGFSPPLAEAVVELSLDYETEVERGIEAIREDVADFYEIGNRLAREGREADFRQALKRRDHHFLMIHGRVDQARAKRILSAHKGDRYEATTARYLTLLREALPGASWERFKSFLRDENSPRGAFRDISYPLGGAR
jgi:hypothetical protein